MKMFLKNNHTGSIKNNMIMNAILTMSSFIFPLITFPYISRILWPAGTGKVNFATSVVTYFSMFVQLGIPTYGIRCCAKVRDDKEKLSRTVHELLIINLFMCFLVYIVFIISVLKIPRFSRDKTLFFIIGLSIGLNAIGCEWVYKALEKYSYITVRSIVFKVIALIGMFLFVKKQSDYVIYGGITIFASSCSNILNFWNLRKYIYFKPLKNYNIKQHIKLVLVFFSMSVATTIYTNLDSVMLGFMKGDIEVGYYNAAVKIKSILVSLVTSASAVLLPRASYYVDKGELDKFYQILKKTMHFVILLSFPMMIYFMIFANEGIIFISGDAYYGSIIPMQIIMPTVLFIGMTNIMGIQMMVPLGMEKKVLYSEIAGAVIDLIMNAIFIPIYAAGGAALGTLIAEFIVWIIQVCFIKLDIKKIYTNINFIFILIATLMGCIASIWIKLMNWPLILELIASALLFFGIYLLVLFFKKDVLVLEIFRKFWKRNKVEKSIYK